MPVILIIEEGYHMGQENIISFLTSKKDTKACDSIFHQRLFHNVFWVAQQSDNFLLDHFMQSLKFYKDITETESGRITHINQTCPLSRLQMTKQCQKSKSLPHF